MDINSFKSFPEFNFEAPPGTTWEQIVTYITLLYDKNGDLRKQYSDFGVRRGKAIALAGFKRDKDNKFPESIESIFIGQNTAVNKAITCYLRQTNDPDWILYCTFWELLIQEREAPPETDPKKREYVRKNIFDLVDKIRTVEFSLFGGKETEEVRKSLYTMMEEQRLGLRPEERAQQLTDKEFTF